MPIDQKALESSYPESFFIQVSNLSREKINNLKIFLHGCA